MFSKEEVLYVASLSRIHLANEEVEPLTKTLGDILQYIEKLKKLDVAQVKPTSHVLPLKNIYREDKIKSSLRQEDVLKIAVSHAHGSFKVPQVIE